MFALYIYSKNVSGRRNYLQSIGGKSYGWCSWTVHRSLDTSISRESRPPYASISNIRVLASSSRAGNTLELKERQTNRMDERTSASTLLTIASFYLFIQIVTVFVIMLLCLGRLERLLFRWQVMQRTFCRVTAVATKPLLNAWQTSLISPVSWLTPHLAPYRGSSVRQQ